MDLLIITGFLGSGKTTLLLEIAKNISGKGKKVAIIENEVGELGIDDCLIKEMGYDVREIYSGCICCSLRMDLITTLLSIENEYSPDVVILEPSGVAGPKQVLSALQGYGGEIDRKVVINIVDSFRYKDLESLELPMIRDGLEVADLIVLNKQDLISEEENRVLTESIRDIASSTGMLKACLHDKNDIRELTKEIFRKIFGDSKTETFVDVKLQTKDMPKPAIYSDEKTISLNPEQTVDSFVGSLCDSLVKAGKLLKNEGATVGHLKIMLNAGKNGYIVLSLTSSELYPEIKGTLKPNTKELRYRINIIVYNVEPKKLSDIVENIERTS